MSVDTSVEYLYMSDTELDDEQTKCGEIFVSLRSFDCVFFCIFCKTESKYLTFDDFANHVKGEHLIREHSTESPSPTGGFVAEIVGEDALNYEESDFDAAVEDTKYTHLNKSNGADEYLENLDSATTPAETHNVDLDHDVEMLISDEDCTNNDDNQSIDQLEANFSSYRQCMTEILDMYRKCIGLWHTKTAQKTSHEVKTAALKFIMEKYSTYYPDRTINYLQDRLHNMSKRFNAECKSIEGNIHEDGGESKPWYFRHLLFLRYTNDDEISGEEFQDFNCPSCKDKVAGSTCSIDLWNHIIANHLKILKKDPLMIEQTKICVLQWPEEKILQFIDLYREHESVWNMKSTTYHNRLLKSNAYKAIVEKYNEIYPNVLKDHGSVKDAIRQLREYFSRLDRKYQTTNLLDTNAATLPLNRFNIYEKLLFLRNVSVPRVTSNVEIHTCELCEKPFNKIKDLNAHMKNEHANVIYSCDKCPLVFKSQFKLESHRKGHIRSDGKAYECPICHASFENSDDLATHLNEHLPTKLQKQICEICGANFDDRSNLLIHIRRHTNTKNYICSICSKGFVTSTELKSHVVVHSNERPFVCEICGHRFKYSNRLNTHRLLHGEPKFKCDNCDMKFFTKRHLNDHQRIHAPVAKVNCDICGSLFRNSDSLSRHRRKIHKIKIREQHNMALF